MLICVLKDYRERDRERKRCKSRRGKSKKNLPPDGSLPDSHTSQIRSKPGDFSTCPTWMQESKTLGHPELFFPGHQQETRLEESSHGLKSVLQVIPAQWPEN